MTQKSLTTGSKYRSGFDPAKLTGPSDTVVTGPCHPTMFQTPWRQPLNSAVFNRCRIFEYAFGPLDLTMLPSCDIRYLRWTLFVGTDTLPLGAYNRFF